MLEPVPLRKTQRPPVIPDKVDTRRKDAVVYLADVYAGGGLAGVPRGTVKQLRLFAFDYGYQGLANHTYIGIEGPVGRAPDPGHGPGRAGRLGRVPGAGQHADRRAAAGRGRQGPAAHAELVRGHAGREPLVRRLPRAHDRRAADPADRGRQESAAGDPAVVRPGPRLQLRPRGPAGARPVLRRLPQRRAVRRAAAVRSAAGQRADVQPRLSGAAEVRPPARSGERLPHVPARRVPRRHQPADPDAGTKATTASSSTARPTSGSTRGST